MVVWKNALSSLRQLSPYDVSADGQRFLIAIPPELPGTEPLTVVQNWTSFLRK